MDMKLFGGIDVGSTTTEWLVINEKREILYWDSLLTGGDIKKVTDLLRKRSYERLRVEIDGFQRIVATGYGRQYVSFAHKDVTEITCYARGAHYLNPDIRTVIDIGGQDSKVIALDSDGSVKDFVMNDKCAAGTGRFLEMIAKIFNVRVDELGEIAGRTERIVPISSICAVFAESEVISYISKGTEPADIIHSIHYTVGKRIVGLAQRLDIKSDIMFCGGVAKNRDMVRTMTRLFEGHRLSVPENSEIVGALGAALLAAG